MIPSPGEDTVDTGGDPSLSKAARGAKWGGCCCGGAMTKMCPPADVADACGSSGGEIVEACNVANADTCCPEAVKRREQTRRDFEAGVAASHPTTYPGSGSGSGSDGPCAGSASSNVSSSASSSASSSSSASGSGSSSSSSSSSSSGCGVDGELVRPGDGGSNGNRDGRFGTDGNHPCNASKPRWVRAIEPALEYENHTTAESLSGSESDHWGEDKAGRAANQAGAKDSRAGSGEGSGGGVVTSSSGSGSSGGGSGSGSGGAGSGGAGSGGSLTVEAIDASEGGRNGGDDWTGGSGGGGGGGKSAAAADLPPRTTAMFVELVRGQDAAALPRLPPPRTALRRERHPSRGVAALPVFDG